jgi:hypothetical protein
MGFLTSGIFGPRSTTSSTSTDLQAFLENRLRARTLTLGSTLYKMTWKPWITPSGRSRFRLRASVLRTSATDSTGWPTPKASDGSGGKGPRKGVSITGRMPDGSKVSMGLPETVKVALAGWTTPTTRDWKDSGADIKARADGSQRFDQLPRQANLAGWRTPTCQSPNSLRGNGQDPAKRLAQGHTLNLTDEVNWLKDNPQPARLTATGDLLTGCTAAMESGGQLNPAHPRWLMGLPLVWDDCAPTVTRSTPTRRKSSSKSQCSTDHDDDEL